MTEIRTSEDECDERFQCSVDENSESNLLSDSNEVRHLLRRIGVQFVWSQQDGDDGGCQIVPGMTARVMGSICAT